LRLPRAGERGGTSLNDDQTDADHVCMTIAPNHTALAVAPTAVDPPVTE
jgi:hypothetical protein